MSIYHAPYHGKQVASWEKKWQAGIRTLVHYYDHSNGYLYHTARVSWQKIMPCVSVSYSMSIIAIPIISVAYSMSIIAIKPSISVAYSMNIIAIKPSISVEYSMSIIAINPMISVAYS